MESFSIFADAKFDLWVIQGDNLIAMHNAFYSILPSG